MSKEIASHCEGLPSAVPSLKVPRTEMTTPTDLRQLSSHANSIPSIVSHLPSSDLRDLLRVHANSVGAAAAAFAQSSGSGVYYSAPTIDESDGKTFKAEAKGDGRIAIAPTLLDRSRNSNVTVMSGAEKTEQLERLRVEADFFSQKKYYDDKGKTCAVILNNLFRDCGSLVEPRMGADKDAERLEKLFEDMGIDEDSIFICQDQPYKELRKLLNRVINTVKGGGYSSLIFAIGTHGGSTVNSLIINESRSGSLVEIDLYEHIVYVLSKELVEIPKIFLVQACRNSKENQLEKVPIDTPKEKDEFQEVHIVRATIPNRVALRDPYDGSFFFIHLESVIREHAKDWGLRKIVLEVGSRTAKLPDNLTQIPHIESSTLCTKEYKFKNPKK